MPQATASLGIGEPLLCLVVSHVRLRLCNRFPADTAQHKLVPHDIGVTQFPGCTPLTELKASISFDASDTSKR